MINVRTDKEGYFLAVEGHADFSARGKDIVCSAVSALVFTYIKSLKELLGIEPEINQTGGKNRLEVRIRRKWLEQDSVKKGTELLLGNVMIGLCEIQKQYPQNLKVIEGGPYGS